MRIFLSYTLRDGHLTAAALRRIEESLNEHGLTYVDALHNPGVAPQQHVIEELTKADLVVICLTPGVLESEWVQFELDLARRRQIPILEFRPVLGPDGMIHPTALKRLTKRVLRHQALKRPDRTNAAGSA